ncbi:unnamed protein product [Pleuronectes platessa]|uniref:Uncharacterized protein n=1 Tax=Pleuronectes platessa TaxID=8262 RepID=A0A9N7YEV9_PLEPL|nr:unnamed protein product [Pleuronectes platessa]
MKRRSLDGRSVRDIASGSDFKAGDMARRQRPGKSSNEITISNYQDHFLSSNLEHTAFQKQILEKLSHAQKKHHTLKNAAANGSGSGGKIPTGSQDAMDVHPGLNNLWWTSPPLAPDHASKERTLVFF